MDAPSISQRQKIWLKLIYLVMFSTKYLWAPFFTTEIKYWRLNCHLKFAGILQSCKTHSSDNTAHILLKHMGYRIIQPQSRSIQLLFWCLHIKNKNALKIIRKALVEISWYVPQMHKVFATDDRWKDGT